MVHSTLCQQHSCSCAVQTIMSVYPDTYEWQVGKGNKSHKYMTEQTKLVKQCACALYLAYHTFVESRQPRGGHSSHFSYQAIELCSSGRNLAGDSVLAGTSVFSLLPSLSVSFYLCLVISTGLYSFLLPILRCGHCARVMGG